MFSEWSNSLEPATLTLYLQEANLEIDANRLFPCIVICPGGGYEFTSSRETEPIALRYIAMGYSAAVLEYSTNTAKFPTQICELSIAVAWLRRHKEFLIHPDKIAVCGFSAGGHLAGCLLNFWNSQVLLKSLPINSGENKPNAGILCYPVITTGKFSHVSSFNYLLGDNLDIQNQELLSLEKSVNMYNPPCFLWHTADDCSVPVENSLLYAMALHKYNIQMELHIYPKGPHGLSLGDYCSADSPEFKNPIAAQWFMQSILFLNNIFNIPFSEG